uniref:Uncharacterized protein n=1 Tax=Rhizophora mucronata TaxID=61149 RepID=A0A2P2NYD8_RHIMU
MSCYLDELVFYSKTSIPLHIRKAVPSAFEETVVLPFFYHNLCIHLIGYQCINLILRDHWSF